MDEPLSDDFMKETQGSAHLVQRYADLARDRFGEPPTLRHIAKILAGSSTLRFVGDASQVADQMSEWFLQGACDGFAIVPNDTPGSFEDFVRLVVPILRRRGLMADPDANGTLRDRLSLNRRASR